MEALSYLADPRDRAIFAATPTVTAPRFGVLAPVPVGQHRFVLAANGLFVQARTATLDLTLRVSDTVRLPYGVMEEKVVMVAGRLPRELFQAMRQKALAAHPREWAGVVLFDPAFGGYRLVEPEVESVSSGHIRYRTGAYDDALLVCDVHSHGHHGAYFSGTDDASDQHGIYIASVLGRCGAGHTLESCSRIVIHGLFIDVAWTPWEE
jgi:PRTRC genetic system protein A